jgi:hypothetical protein
MSDGRAESLRRIQREIVGEKAATLGRAGERLEEALAAARIAAARLLAATDEAERERRAQEYASARARAHDARMMLVIQREALGLRRHATVDQQFPEPPTIDRLLGSARDR